MKAIYGTLVSLVSHEKVPMHDPVVQPNGSESALLHDRNHELITPVASVLIIKTNYIYKG